MINNAKRYGAEPIELSAKVENECILITVADHGEGIPADQIEELMQPLFAETQQELFKVVVLGWLLLNVLSIFIMVRFKFIIVNKVVSKLLFLYQSQNRVPKKIPRRILWKK